MKKTHKIVILFLVSAFSSLGQTNTIAGLNKILTTCTDQVCFTKVSIKPDGSLICCSNKRSLKLNETKTEIIYTQKHFNSTDNKLMQTFITKIKIKDIDFIDIKPVGASDGTKSVIINQVNTKKTVVTTCQGVACSEAISYGDNIGISFGPDCIEENLHQKFIDLFKTLEQKK